MRLGWTLGFRLGAARLNGSNMARVDVTRLLPLARVGETGLQSPRCPIELIFAAVSSYG